MRQLRRYAPRDRAAALACFRCNLPQFFAPHELGEFTAFLNRLDGEGIPDLHYTTVLEQGEALAFGGWFRRKDSKLGGLAWGMVHREHHRRGLGTRLLEHRLGAMSGLSACVIDTTPASFGFYARFGFVQTELKVDGYAPGMDQVIARCPLKGAQG